MNKLSKQEEAKVLEVYKTYFDSYVNGDVKTIAALLDDGYTQIGSAESEVFFNKKDALQFMYDTIDEVAGKAEMRNRVIELVPLQEYVLVVDLWDMYVLSDSEWSFYSRFRASTLMEKINGEWKMVYQHSSMPDLRVQEGGNLAIEKITKENLELRDAVKRRTIELEQKNRELAIEAALERVRAVAMGMRTPEDLPGICEVLFTELRNMGFSEMRNAMINIYDDGKSSFVNYDYSDEIGRSINHLTYDIHPVIEKQVRQIRSNDDAFSHTVFSGKDLDDWKAFRKEIGEKTDPRIESISALYYYFYSIDTGAIGISTFGAIQEEKLQLLRRFRNVFDFAYRRYVDVAQAEAQAREARIEAALERVRSGAMAMRTSDELNSIIGKVFEEGKLLDIHLDRGVIMLYDLESLDSNWWMANPEAPDSPVSYHVSYHDYPPYQAYLKAWNERVTRWTYLLEGEEKREWDSFLFINTELALLPPPVKASMTGHKKVYLNGSFNNFGSLTLASVEPMTDENFEILLRFAHVFDLTYTRFNDLKQAEAQAREAQIQLALERVRARTMAMQHSSELKDAAGLLFQQVKELGIDAWTCGYNIWDEDMETVTSWLSRGVIQPPFKIRLTENQTLNHFYEAAQRGDSLFVEEVSGEALTELYRFLGSQLEAAGVSEAIRQPGYTPPVFQVNYAAFFSYGHLLFVTYKQYPEAHDIFRRFAKVFEQTYTRFLDLQKAEAQVREAQIESSLERVRSKTMAMHNSKDVGETVATMFDEFIKIGIVTNRCGILIFSDPKFTEVWTAKTNPAGGVSLIIGHLDTNMHPMLTGVYKAWQNAEKTFSYELAGVDIKDYYNAINNSRDYPTRFDLNALPDREIHSDFFFAEGAVFAFTLAPIPENSSLILKRFAAVFGQTYRRYLDLQKAEAQAREATIEAALERVRYQAMAMQNSDDVGIATATMFTELDKLGIENLRCGIAIISPDQTMEVLSAANTEDGKIIRNAGFFDMNEHPFWQGMFKGWSQKNDFFHYFLQGEDKQAYYEILSRSPGYTLLYALHASPDQHFQTYFFQEGCIWSCSLYPHTEEENKVFRKFTAVFSLTFRRYLDLKNAEAQARESEANAREAVRQASLDRIRAEIASMRTVFDLDRITPLVWNELTTLGVPFIRCGVFIMDEQKGLIHTFLSTPEGKALAAFHLSFHTKGSIRQVLGHWHQKQIYTEHWGPAEFADWTKNLAEQGALVSQERYVNEFPSGSLDLHFFPFAQGMLYVGNTAPLTAEENRLVQSLADAFSTAYARYEDFNRLEEAKQQVDKTLTDLKQTQAQLVQAEKMASLGELTAGIAHEIQNPLNFVNNFSELSNELIGEMNEEIRKGHIEEAEAIAADIRQNLEKINYHGKRADAIVKGMLQHSRAASGEKQLTDINALADEFLRLAYHGIRAKDNAFNAKFDSDFDQSIGKIMIIPQDIGRVLVNLINNAFYAVAEKRKQSGVGYDAAIAVSTKKIGDRVELRIADNGMGIPGKIKDKIFQPFFTTKPTGQGTGLGLSLSYDIIKAHGGEIRVESGEGEGTSFIISLPV